MRSARNVLLAAFVATLVVGPAPGAHAQIYVPSTPEEVAEQMFLATRSQDWRAVAELMHPEAVTQFHSMLQPVLDLIPEGDSTLVSLFAVDSAAELEHMEPIEFFESFVAGLMGGIYGELGVLSDMQNSIVGSVVEGDSLSHVVYRTTYGMMDVSFTQLQVMTTKRYYEGWRLLLTAELAGISQLLEQMTAQMSRQEFSIPIK